MGQIISLRKLKKKIKPRSATLVGGMFDLFHVGHLRFLRECAKQGRPLVVAIASDRMTRKHKGAGRPIIPAHRRAEIVAALDFVDYALVLPKPAHDPTYLSLVNPRRYIFSRERGKMAKKMAFARQITAAFPRIAVVFLKKGVPRSSTSYIVKNIIAEKGVLPGGCGCKRASRMHDEKVR